MPNIVSASSVFIDTIVATDEESMTAELSQMISRVDEALAEQNINASSCLQRVMCSFAQPSSGDPSTISSFMATAVK